MSTLEVRRRTPTATDLKVLEKKIIDRRREYAALDLPEYKHIYLGFIESGVQNLLTELQRQVDWFRRRYPSSTFTLEYHPSCITHIEYPFQVYSFTLIKKVETPTGQRRQLMIMSWKVPFQEDYSAENQAIESFMHTNKVDPYDDGSEEPCRIGNLEPTRYGKLN